MKIDVPVVAGVLSTSMFALATMPMLIKAARTKNLSSYSVGNLLYSFYIFSLPMGPVWVLHIFNMIIGLTMLTWWVQYRAPRTTTARQDGGVPSQESATLAFEGAVS